MPIPSPKELEDFYASSRILAANIQLFHEGHRDLYRVVAVELRKLLCDGKSSLVTRMSPRAAMHPLRSRLPEAMKQGLAFHMPSVVHFDGKGGARIVELFDLSAPVIPVVAWLDQDLFNSKVTIRELIRSVADKESAHSDRDYNETLELARSIKLVDEDIHKQHIVAIGEHVLAFMQNTIDHHPHLFNQFHSMRADKT